MKSKKTKHLQPGKPWSRPEIKVMNVNRVTKSGTSTGPYEDSSFFNHNKMS